MTKKSANRIINSLFVIRDAFKQISTSEQISSIIETERFLHIFDDIEDFRQDWKIEYKLSDILMLSFIVILRKEKAAFYFISDYVRVNSAYFEEIGLIHDGRVPSHDTFRRVFEYLDSESFSKCTIDTFYSFLKELENQIPKQGKKLHYGVDGKEIRGSGRANDTEKPIRNTAMLNFYDSGLDTCFCCVPIDEKTNEIPVGQDILKHLSLKNVIITADALHCQKKTADIISRKKGTYLLVAKDNQPLLAEEIKSRFKRFPEKIHKEERDGRTIEFYTLPKNYARDGWTGMKTFIKMTSQKSKKGCIRYFISNSTDVELLCEGIESRWEIEDNFHRPKDVILREDEIRSTNKNALNNLALLNNLILQLEGIYATITDMSLRYARMYFSDHPRECINTILAVMDSEEIIESIKEKLKKA